MSIDLIRGMNNVPLTLEGIEEGVAMAGRIRAKGGVNRIISSPLKRAKTTARIIEEHVPGARYAYSTPKLEPMHLGKYEGQSSQANAEDIKYYMEHPNVPVPGYGPISLVKGESSGEFFLRFIPYLLHMVREQNPDERVVLLAHYRNIKAAMACDDFDKCMVCPDKMCAWPDDIGTTNLFTVRLAGKKFAVKPVALESNDPLPWGTVFLGRHGKTALNG